MDDVVDVRMLIEYFVQGCFICDVELVESRTLSADEFYAVDDLLGRIVQVVYNNDLIVGLKQSESGE